MLAYKATPRQRALAAALKRKLRADDPEGQKQLKRESHARNKLANNAATRAWRIDNPEKFKASVKRWYDAHPEAKARNRNRRRARKAGAEGNHSRAEWTGVCEAYGRCCAYCGTSAKLTRHHVVPLSKGGSDWISNIVPACGSCNSRIGTKTVLPPASRKTECTATEV